MKHQIVLAALALSVLNIACGQSFVRGDELDTSAGTGGSHFGTSLGGNNTSSPQTTTGDGGSAPGGSTSEGGSTSDGGSSEGGYSEGGAGGEGGSNPPNTCDQAPSDCDACRACTDIDSAYCAQEASDRANHPDKPGWDACLFQCLLDGNPNCDTVCHAQFPSFAAAHMAQFDCHCSVCVTTCAGYCAS